MKDEKFVSMGKAVDSIDVRISHRIIQLFSEGLYSSPHKAIEELVSNSFDARAENVHVILSPDLTAADATIVVIDDGEGMDPNALKEHWIIGRSRRRDKASASGRSPIGKFGIGKLATYVLAERLTHICKSSDGKIYATTMDYTTALPPSVQPGISDASQEGVFNDNKINIPIRELTEKEAQEIIEPWINGSRPGYQALKLFGSNAKASWTVAIMSGLKPMGKRISRGKLTWILRTAMPLRDDFHLFLSGEPIESSKIEEPLIEKWIIGKEIVADTLKKPCPDDFVVTEDQSLPVGSIHRYGLSHPQLGRITGFMELYEYDLSGGKSAQLGRSNGFFVYVRGRMINTADEDDGFGIPRNLLRHGTFSQFRMVVHVDSLDDALRSSRESLKEGELYALTQNFLHAAFNLARNRLVEYEKTQSPASLLSSRISSTPGSLTRTPLFALAKLAIEGKVRPLYIRLPDGLNAINKDELIAQLQNRLHSEDDIVKNTILLPLDSRDGIALFEIAEGRLIINTAHPFVAAFQEIYTKAYDSMPLDMYAMAEILTEANLYYLEVDETKIRDILNQRDEILRYFVRSAVRRTPGIIAMSLLDAKDNADNLEEETRAAFEAIGFDNVIRIGGNGKPDGTADAYLPATEEGEIQRYRVGFETKSGGKVSAKRLDTAGLYRHMSDYKCDHHIVVGNQFETSTGEDSASVIQINELKRTTGKTITLMRVDDLARLVRLMPAKRINLQRLRELFRTCTTPEETKKWIDDIEKEEPERKPYKEILETIWQRGQSREDHAIEYAAVMTAMEYLDPPIKISKIQLIEYCKAMQAMAGGAVFARENTVEIRRRPDQVLQDIQHSIDEYPENERKNIVL
jgi:hypothetical protein